MTKVAAQVATDLPVPGHDPGRVHSLTNGILADPQFRPSRRGVLSAAWHWLTTEAGKLAAQLFGGSPGSAEWVGLVAVAVVAVVVMAMVVMTVLGAGRRGRRGRLPGVVVHRAGAGRSASEWRQQAAAHEAAGRWRDAVRCRYRALIAELAGRGVVEEIPGRTSGEYRLDVGAAVPGAAPSFDRATSLFEEAWYGDRPIGPGDPAAFEDVSDRALSEAKPGWQSGRPAAAAPQPAAGAR